MSVFPHLLLVTDELAKVTVIEHFRSSDQKRRRICLRRERSRGWPRRQGDLRMRPDVGRKRARAADELRPWSITMRRP